MDEKLVINRLQILSFANSAAASSAAKSASEFKMDALVHDLNTALELDEVNNSSANAGSGSGAPNSTRRRVWRRRCKSTSNLCLNTGSSATAEKKNQSQNSDGSSSSEDDTRAVIMTNDRGTSSLQLSDSEEDKIPRPASIVPKLRSKMSTPNAGGGSSNQLSNKKLLNVADTDSVNENFSPVSRPSTKRKRKFKRMALDPDNSDLALVDPLTVTVVKNKTGTIKRKKVRSKSACETAPKSSRNVTLKSPKRQRQVSTANVVPGKRKRSSREKSVEPDLIISQSAAPSHSMITEEPTISNDAMDCDDGSRRSSSSLSSSDWEETEVPEEATIGLRREDDGEADDEQSDWPGPESGSVYGGFTDDEQDLDSSTPSLSALSIYSIPSSEMENFQSLTSTARQAYLARMKRLADCVPGREIRAGSRRLRNPQSGFTIKSSSSEQLSRFLQDPQRTELRLTVLRATDRDKIAQMAALYSLQLRSDENPNMLVLAKTGKTVKVDCFIVPKTPAAKANVDVKRRRRTPPPNPTAASTSSSTADMLEDKSLVNNELTRRQSN